MFDHSFAPIVHNPAALAIPGTLAGVRITVGQPQFKHRQVRFPRSKKKRIRKKWAKDQRNWIKENEPYLYQVGTGLDTMFYCDPYTYAEIERRFAEI